MSMHLPDTYGLRLLDAAASVDDERRGLVRELVAGLYPVGPFERRGVQRYPLPKLIRLRPVGADGITPVGPTIVVAGKHVSESGLSFFHPQPLPYRLVIAALEKADGTTVDFLLDVDWCRFTRSGWYESGGRFVAAD